MWHLLRGRLRLWQYYTNVTWSTCEECLQRHGRILSAPTALPDPGDGCERKLLPLAVWELGAHRERARRMRELAREELARRRLLAEGSDLLTADLAGALDRLDRAGAVDVYLPELERLADRHGEWLAGQPAVRRRLQELFLRRWSGKFAKPRYERLPERMRLARERWGERRIKELFS